MNFKLRKKKAFKKFKKIFSLLLFALITLSCSAQKPLKKIDIFFEEKPLQNTNNSAEQENFTEKNDSSLKKPNLRLTRKITVELAISAKEQEKGFMKRQIIPEGTGMIFLYKEDRKMRFWMKNTPHPLSIAYIDSSGQVREIYDMVPYSLQSVASTHSVRYALEVPQGMFKRMGIAVGDRLTEKSVLLLKRQLKSFKSGAD